MSAQSEQAKKIFLHLVGNMPADQWENELDAACSGDQEVRARVQALLEAHKQADSFLERAAAAVLPTIELNGPTERPGTMIGHYKLLQQIGEGGFGVVYLAEQIEPIPRRVALKIIKPGMDCRQVIARFEAEQRALAMMDHPNIARVFDAGTTDAGRPYFVMELVKGVRITEFCDHNKLTVPERLNLFVQVCQAIQHAHQKGIIHRDIKPSNVLVTLHDGEPVAKVIDFGVARATEQRLTEKTLFTQFGQIVGTLEYMSPEQAEMSGLEIDTRSDIYSLGILLYELLTGSPPIDSQRLREGGFQEMMRAIREEEPPKPSLRLSQSADALPSIAARRGLEPAKLTRFVRGDVDWIVMKALDKDRRRRYVSATAFAADIERHLGDKPIEACPPSVTYKLSKFLRRNRRGVTGAVVITAALTLAIVAFLKPPRAADPRSGLLDRAHEFVQQQRFPEAVEAFQQVLNWDRTHRGDESPEYRSTSLELARLYDSQGRYTQSVELYDHVLEQQKRKLGPGHMETRLTTVDFSAALNHMSWAVSLEGGNGAFAETLAKKAISVSAEIPPTPPVFAWMASSSAYHSLAFSQIQSDRPGEALESLANRVDWYNPHPWYLMAIALHQAGQKEKARTWYAVASDSTYQDDYVAMQHLRALTATTLGMKETWPPADWNAVKGIDACTQIVSDYPKVSWLFNRRAAYRASLGKWTEAASDYAKAAELLPWEPAHALNLGVIYAYLGDRQKHAEVCRSSFVAAPTPLMGDIVDGDYHSARRMLLCFLSPTMTPEEDNLRTCFRRYLPGAGSHSWMKVCKALAAYRSGLYRETLASVPYEKDWQCRTFGQLVKAMAQCRLGNVSEAQQTLKETRFEIQQRVPHFDTSDLIRDDVMYLNCATTWCALQVLLREAESVIEPANETASRTTK